MKKLLVLLFCLILVGIGNCLECYVCQSVPNGTAKCGDPFDENANEPEHCLDSDDVCLKEKLYSLEDVPDNMHRGCVDPDYCKGKVHVHCSTCFEDNCNSSFTGSPSSYLLGSTAFVLLFFKRVFCLK